MRIGILTYWTSLENYGQILQLYALYTYLRQLDRFLAPGLTDRPMLFEVFTDSRDESDAIRIMNNLNVSPKGVLKEVVKSVVGEKGKEMIIKKVMGR